MSVAGHQPQIPRQPSQRANDHSATRGDAPDHEEGQAPNRSGTARASAPGLRRLGATHAREAGGGGRYRDRLCDLDPLVARAGHRRRSDDTLRPRAGRAGRGDATRYLGLSGETGGPADASDRQPAVPALLEATIFTVLSPLQPLRDEVLPARSLAVLGLRAVAVRDRQHESGAAAWHGPKRGNRAGNGHLRQSVWF